MPLRKAAFSLALLAALPAAAAPAPERQRDLEHMVKHDCGSCHGMTRKGGLGSPLLPEVLRQIPDDALTATILHGRPGTPMPGWQGLLTEDEAQWIVTYLKDGRHED